MKKYLELAHRIYKERFIEAKAFILAGSIVRGESTPTSDLDIVIIYEDLKSAYRESFIYEGVMVEVFVHDLSSLKYFMYEFDYEDGVPSMASMILEGIPISGETDFVKELKHLAKDYMDKGPKESNDKIIRGLRYSITNLIDDLADSRNRHEQIATACRLYEEVANLYFSVNRFWKGKAKSTVRAMMKYDPLFAQRYNDSFDLLFREGNIKEVLNVTEELLNACGGYLFDGYKQEANPE